jgi:nucleotide-binding universal stress UspA family protein
MSIRTILVPTDFSENARRAFEFAFALACDLGARIHLLHVQDESSLRTAVKEGLLRDDSTDEQVQEAVQQLLESRLAEVIQLVDCSRIEIVSAIRRGDPRALTVSYAVEAGADLVVAGRRGEGLMEDLRSAIVGSVTETLIRNSPCPVLVVRRDHEVIGFESAQEVK